MTATPRTLDALPPDRARDLARVERMARLLDARYRIPGTRIRFGLDGLVGLIPGIGDTLTLLPQGWMLWTAWKHGVPKGVLASMAGTVAIDYVVGSIPIVGDIFDVGYKANLKNADRLRAALTDR